EPTVTRGSSKCSGAIEEGGRAFSTSVNKRGKWRARDDGMPMDDRAERADLDAHPVSPLCRPNDGRNRRAVSRHSAAGAGSQEPRYAEASRGGVEPGGGAVLVASQSDVAGQGRRGPPDHRDEPDGGEKPG